MAQKVSKLTKEIKKISTKPRWRRGSSKWSHWTLPRSPAKASTLQTSKRGTGGSKVSECGSSKRTTEPINTRSLSLKTCQNLSRKEHSQRSKTLFLKSRTSWTSFSGRWIKIIFIRKELNLWKSVLKILKITSTHKNLLWPKQKRKKLKETTLSNLVSWTNYTENKW